MQLQYEKQPKEIRCVLPRTPLPFGENGKYLEQFFKDQYEIDIQYFEEVKTVPGSGKENSRIDQLFTVKEESLDKFTEIKDGIGALFAIDVVKNGDHRLYNERTFLRYFQRFELQLLKSGELLEEYKYQSLFKK